MDDGDDDDFIPNLKQPFQEETNMKNSIMKNENRILCSEIPSQLDKAVTIQGWVHSFRRLGKISFLTLRDRSGMIQAVLENDLANLTLSLESVVSVSGKINASNHAKQGVELLASELQLLSEAQSPLPIEINKNAINAHLDTVLDNRVLSLRHTKTHATFVIQSTLAGAFREFLSRYGFTQIFSPKIVAAGTEGGSNLFPIDYFDQKAYLAQSPQFYKQMMVGAGFERVFEIGPVYRAEEHNTSRHLNEYTSLDVEVGFIESFEQLMELEEQLLGYMFDKVNEQCREQLDVHNVSLPKELHIPRVTVAEAHEILVKNYSKTSPEGDLDPEGERLICDHFSKLTGHGLVFITHYPTDVRPMYAMPGENNLTLSFDLLYNGLEITSGGQRIHLYDQLVESIVAKGLEPEQFEGYLEIFKYGMPPHGGFAIGLERLTSRTLGLANVREATAFPRDRNRLTP